MYTYITVAKFTITHVTIHKLDIGMHTYIYNGGKTTFDIYFIEFGIALTTIVINTVIVTARTFEP